MATLAIDLGMIDPPRSVAALEATIQRFRPELRLSAEGATARDFVIRGVQRGADCIAPSTGCSCAPHSR